MNPIPIKAVQQRSTKSGSTSRPLSAPPGAAEGPSGGSPRQRLLPGERLGMECAGFPPELTFPPRFPAGPRAERVWGRSNGGALAALPACPGDVAMAAPGAAPGRGRSGGPARAPRGRPCFLGGSESRGDLPGRQGLGVGFGRADTGEVPRGWRDPWLGCGGLGGSWDRDGEAPRGPSSPPGAAQAPPQPQTSFWTHWQNSSLSSPPFNSEPGSLR